MTAKTDLPPIVASSLTAKRFVRQVTQLVQQSASIDEQGARLADKLKREGGKFDRLVREIEAYADAQLAAEPTGRSMAARRRDLRDWGWTVFSLFVPWVTGDGADRAKLAAAATRSTEDRKKEIEVAATRLLRLIERNAGARDAEMGRGAPYLPVDVLVPHLRRDLLRLIDVAKGARRIRRRALDAEARALDGLPVGERGAKFAYGAEGFIADLDRAMPFEVTSPAVIDLWEFVSARVISEGAVRAARKRAAARTS